MFIIKRDLQRVLNSKDVTVLLSDDNINSSEVLNNCIDFAVDFVRSKIAHRFDPDQIFIDVQTYSSTATYSVNDQVDYQGTLYYCILVTTAGILPTNATYFTKGDIRKPLARDYVTKETIYQLFMRIQPRNIPEWLILDHDKMIEHLNMISRGVDTPNLPLYNDVNGDPDDTLGQRTIYNSETQIKWNY